MLPFIAPIWLFLRGNFKIVVIAVGTLLIMFFMWQFAKAKADAREWQAKVESYEVLLAQNQEEIDRLVEYNRAIERAFAKELQEAEKRHKFLSKLIEDIRNAPKENNGAVAPVIKHLLDSLRDYQNSTHNSIPEVTTP